MKTIKESTLSSFAGILLFTMFVISYSCNRQRIMSPEYKSHVECYNSEIITVYELPPVEINGKRPIATGP